MSQTATLPFKPSPVTSPVSSTVSDGREFEDASPFGMQGLTRDLIQIVKPEFISRLAISLALRGTRDQIRDPEFVKRQLSSHPDWLDEYQVVHLIERSLWIQGHSDLVMTMTRNPSQIPDNPPAKVKAALARAYALHPQSTIWYGVPLFGAEQNSDGLPIPVTAAEVRTEAARRIRAAQQHALRWGWFYRAILGISRMPARCWHLVSGLVRGVMHGVTTYWKRAREDARRRTRAEILRQREYFRTGCSQTEIPEHSTWLGRGLDATAEVLAFHAALVPFIGPALAPLAVSTFAPLLFVPITIVSCDPFLFVELPEEPGKLRHIGHWYWQTQADGQKLHLHV